MIKYKQNVTASQELRELINHQLHLLQDQTYQTQWWTLLACTRCRHTPSSINTTPKKHTLLFKKNWQTSRFYKKTEDVAINTRTPK